MYMSNFSSFHSVLSAAYRGKSVLVTGHTGFKGSWLALWLHDLGAEVHGYALPPPTIPCHFAVCGVRNLLASHAEADIRDTTCLEDTIRRVRPDFLFHLAAQALVRPGYAAPLETFDVNVRGTASVLDAVRRTARPCSVVVVTSDKCYENRNQSTGYREEDPLGGYDPYSASKGAAEIVAAAYRRSFFAPERLAEHGIRLATARAGNVIGGGDWAQDRLVPDLVAHLAAGRPAPVRSPQAVRPWQHVCESVSAYLLLGARLAAADGAAFCEPWNFGPAAGTERTVAELADAFCAAWGGGTWRDASQADAPHEAVRLTLAIDKAVNRLGWRPRWNFAQAVHRTAAWYRAFYATPTESMLATSRADIAEYMQAS
jgi:CDP-glucose 4,6-dehydratase